MSKSPTMTPASGPSQDAARVSREDARRWQLQLTLPAHAALETISADLWAMLASLFDVILRRQDAALAQQPVPFLRWRVPNGGPRHGAAPGYWKDLQAILERFWGIRLHQELVPRDALPQIFIKTAVPAGDAVSLHAPAAPGPARSPCVVTFTPDIDSLAAVSRILDLQREPPVLVMCDPTGGARAPLLDDVARLLDACRSRVATLVIRAPEGRGRTAGAAMSLHPDDLRLVHVLAAVCVARACGAGETQVPQNGVANLNLPVTAATLSRPAHPIDPTLASSLSLLLSRMTGGDIRIRNPLLADTPSEIVADLIERGPRRLDMDLHAICGLVAHDNTYEARVDHHVSILGALHVGSTLTEQYERKLMPDLLVPVNQELADTYVRAIRELPAMSDRDVISRLDEGATPAAASRDLHALAIKLLRRHTESVRHVLARAMQRYAHEIVAGTLAATCLLMRATLPEVTASVNARTPIFRKVGKAQDCWELWFEHGEALYLKGSKGLDYIHVLLQAPGRAFSPVELRDALSGQGRLPAGTLGPVADMQAIQAYQGRLSELKEDLETATEYNDIGRIDGLMYQIEALEQELSRCVGLGGRVRQNSDAERARKSVSNAIYRTLHQLRDQHPALFRHLSAALKIGSGVSYQPTDGCDWDT